MKKLYCLFILLTFLSTYLYAQERPSNIPTIMSKKPKYTNEFVRLEKLYSIPTADESEKNRYLISEVYDMDVDKDSNLYVLDFFLCTITVFDKKGEYIRTLGGRGQGPGELIDPECFSIWNDKIYVYEQFYGIKIFDLKGKYIDSNIVRNNHFNILDFKIFNDLIYTVEWIPAIKEQYLFNKISTDFVKSQTIYTINPEHKNEYPRLRPVHTWTLNNNGDIYFASEPVNTYRIDVFTNEGKLIQSFGREFKRIPFSESTEKILKNKLKGTKLLKYPSIINYLFFDNDCIFVVVGENSSLVSQNYRIDSIIDIFSTKGEYLYTFKSKYFGAYNTVIKNNRLYAHPTNDDLTIHVFQIRYNK
jgi:hypothetical protein